MQFFDKVTISVQAGAWWDGMATWRREAYVAYWWPAWWDWGDWGSVYFEATSNEYTLMPYRANKIYKAQSWEHGQWKDRYGKSGEDITLLVPVGTVISDADTGKHYASLDKAWTRCRIVWWGKWWLWNKHFVDAQKQYSTIAFTWEPGEKRALTLELQLLSDVALIWSPSVWKSSLINVVSNAKAKVAEYHFTTLTPNLWIVSHLWSSFSMIDIPWLIKWAHEGKGLGYEFLRHIVKSSVMLFVNDLSLFEAWIDDIIAIIEELRLYCIEQFSADYDQVRCDIHEKEWSLFFVVLGDWEIIMEKAFGFISNKTDLVHDKEVIEELVWELHSRFVAYTKETYKKTFDNKLLKANSFAVSAWTWEGKEAMLTFCKILVAKNKAETNDEVSTDLIDIPKIEIPEPAVINITETAIPELIEEWYLQEDLKKYPAVRSIAHQKVWYYAYVLPWGNDEAELWFRTYLAQQWIMDRLQHAWVKKGDLFKIQSPYRQRKDLLIKRD